MFRNSFLRIKRVRFRTLSGGKNEFLNTRPRSLVAAISCVVTPSSLSYLRERQIGVEVYYPRPLHLQECFMNLGYRRGDLPESEFAAAETVALPIYPELAAHQMDWVVHSIADFCKLDQAVRTETAA